jgi:hypothetical protein
MTFKKDHRSITSPQGLVKSYLRSMHGETEAKSNKATHKDWIEIMMVFRDCDGEVVKRETARPALGRLLPRPLLSS